MRSSMLKREETLHHLWIIYKLLNKMGCSCQRSNNQSLPQETTKHPHPCTTKTNLTNSGKAIYSRNSHLVHMVSKQVKLPISNKVCKTWQLNKEIISKIILCYPLEWTITVVSTCLWTLIDRETMILQKALQT